MKCGVFAFRQMVLVFALATNVLLFFCSVAETRAQSSIADDATKRTSIYNVSDRDLLWSFQHIPSAQEEALIMALPGTVVTVLNPQSSTHRTYRIQISNPSYVTVVNELLDSADRQGFGLLSFNKNMILSFVVTDPFHQWYMSEPTNVAFVANSPNTPNLSQPTAHDLTNGSPLVSVAVVDMNPDEEQSQMLDLPAPTVNFEANPRTPAVTLGMDHATQVSAVIFSQQNNSIGISGVCPSCTWHAYNLHGEITSTFGPKAIQTRLGDIIPILDMINSSDAQIINMSWGMPVYDSSLDLMLQELAQNGKLMFAAAGNSALPNPLYPASDSKVVAVGAIQSDDTSGVSTLWVNSNLRSDFVAPGDRIILPRYYPQVSAVGYTGYSGTSYASPHVAGVAALVLSEILEQPSTYSYSSSLDAVERAAHIRSILERSATDMGLPGKDFLFGHGLVNAYEALRTLQSDNFPVHVPDLVLGFSEWTQDQIPSAAPFLPLFQQRLVATQPTLLYQIERSERHGECIVPGSYKFREPQASTVVQNANIFVLQPLASPGSEMITLRTTANIDFSFEQRVAYAPSNPLECLVGWDSSSFIVSWNGSNSNTTTIDVHFRLGERGYERVSYERVLPDRSLQYSFSPSGHGLSSHYGSFVANVEPILEMLEDAYVFELIAMTEDIARSLTSFDRTSVSNYTRMRTSGAPLNQTILTPVIGSPTGQASFTHSPNRNQSESQIGVRMPKSNYQTGIVPGPSFPQTPAVPFDSNIDDVTVYTHANFYDSLLENYFANGRFTSLYNQDLTASVYTETKRSAAPLNLQLSAELIAAPRVVWNSASTPQDTSIGEIVGFLSVGVDVSGAAPHSDTYVFEIRVPLLKQGIFKDATAEKAGEAVTSAFEERLNPDFFAAEVTLLGFSGNEDDELATGVLFEFGELSTAVRELSVFPLVRQFASLSGWASDAFKELGSFGCLNIGFEGLEQMFGIGFNGTEAISIDERIDCFNLDLGVWLPAQSPPYRLDSGFAVRDVEFVPREVRASPRAQYLSLAQALHTPHPQIANHYASYLTYEVAASHSTGDEEVRTYFDGVASSPYADMKGEQVYLYEQIWQAALIPSGVTPGGSRILGKWVPNRAGATQPFEVITVPRTDQLNIGDTCLPRVEVAFSYQSLVPPFSYDSAWAESHTETSVYSSRNTWTSLASSACDLGGHGPWKVNHFPDDH